MQPLVFEPHLRPQIWGGRRLELLGKLLPPEGLFGECWEISAHPLHVSRVAEGPLRGAALTDVWRDHGRELLGRAPRPGEKFPLLVKFLDCRELLSVQVHPDDATARRLIGDEQGKSEAWVVLQAEPGSRIYAGLKPGIGRPELEHHLEAGTLPECLHSFAPQAGDCLLLRAGTVHAVGGGVLLAEVQQSSDATFRLFDWGRVGLDGKPRTLHVPEALESIDWTAGPVGPLSGRPLECRPLAPRAVHLAERDDYFTGGAALGREVAGEQLAVCRYFELRRYCFTNTLTCLTAAGLSIWMLLTGAAELHSPEGYRRRFAAGETVLIPAEGGSATWHHREEAPATILEARRPRES